VVLEGIKRAGLPRSDRGKKDRAAITEAITNLRDFDGVLGKWSFDQNGDTSLKVMAVEEIKDGKFTPVKIVGM
jgi:branched-chain amino acid transport system substrate-binding protein